MNKEDNTSHVMQLGRLARWRELQYPPEHSWLQPGEQQRLATFSSPSRRQQFVAGRWLMRELLAQARGGELLRQTADVDESGRSFLPRGHANLSHSGEWAVVAQADDAPIGVDLERLRPRADLLGLAQQVCSPAQCDTLAALQEGEARLNQFYRWWTLKEAWLKARGQGLDMARMRGLEFMPCGVEDDADSCSALLPQAGLMLSIHTQEVEPSNLPSTLADEPVTWQFFRSSSHG